MTLQCLWSWMAVYIEVIIFLSHGICVPAGLETFGVKLPEAAKLFGKKFASGASITKNPMEKDQIEVCQSFSLVMWHANSPWLNVQNYLMQVQGDFVDKAAELIVKTYKDKGIEKKHIYAVIEKKKGPYFDDTDDDED